MYAIIRSKESIKEFGEQIRDLKNCLMLFSMDQCPFCEVLKPVWYEALGERKNVTTFEINSTAYRTLKSTYPKFFKDIVVLGFPTIIYKSGSKLVSFDEPRTKENILKFIDKHSQSKYGGRKAMEGIYVRGPKKGKLKKGYRYVNGLPTKVH